MESLTFQTTVVSPVLDAEPGVNKQCGSSSYVVLAQVLSPECLLPLVPVSKNVLVWRQAQSHKLEQVVQERDL